MAAGEPAAVQDVVRVRHSREEEFVLQTKAGEWHVIGECQGRHGGRFRADQHAAVGHGRQPVGPISEVELREAEAKTDHRAGEVRPGVVSHGAYVEEEIIARLHVNIRRRRQDAFVAHPVAIRKGGVGAVSRGALDTRMCEARGVSVAGEVALHSLAQCMIELAGLG